MNYFTFLNHSTNSSQTHETYMHLFMMLASCPNYLFITLAKKYMYAVQKRECTQPTRRGGKIIAGVTLSFALFLMHMTQAKTWDVFNTSCRVYVPV